MDFVAFPGLCPPLAQAGGGIGTCAGSQGRRLPVVTHCPLVVTIDQSGHIGHRHASLLPPPAAAAAGPRHGLRHPQPRPRPRAVQGAGGCGHPPQRHPHGSRHRHYLRALLQPPGGIQLRPPGDLWLVGVMSHDTALLWAYPIMAFSYVPQYHRQKCLNCYKLMCP